MKNSNSAMCANYTSFISNVASGAFNTEGGIMLTHELNNFTMSEAVKFYLQLQAAFSHIVPVGVALNKSQPYIETNYTLPSFAECKCLFFAFILSTRR
ncbi:hypothetical protein DENSPDRAFT_779668 [Dentipellis sp. KUC8613]|nr:hypothetical protein DENSPDRAFT_779668 [Dentipellis sp. KUC8613]